MQKKIDYNKVVQIPEEGLLLPDGTKEEIKQNYPLKERIQRVLIPESCIKKRVIALAKQIVKDHKHVQRLYMVPILTGAFVFAADLGREIHRFGGPEVKIDFYEAETYGTEIKQSGQEKRVVKIKKRPEYISDIDVLLIDDIADTLRTLSAIKRDCMVTLDIKPEQLKICFLLDKILKNPSEEVKKLRHELKPDYVGFEVPDVWVAGYGIDAGEDFRLLTSIIAVKETYYLKKG